MSNADFPSPETPPHAKPAAPPPEKPVTPEDAGARALEDALRSSFVIVKAVMIILVVVFIFSGVRIVGPQERAVLFRLGKPVGVGEDQLLGPGLHLAWPYPIDEIRKIPIGEVQTATSTVGWYAMTREQELAGTEPFPMPSLNPAVEGYAITGDGNIVHARATLSYRVNDPLAYAFEFTAASNIVQNILNSALVHAAARSPVDLALYDNAAFRERIVARITEKVAEQNVGIQVDSLVVSVIAPRFVKDAFDQVVNAEQDRSSAINKARAEAGALVSTAQGEASRLLAEGRATSSNYVRAVQAEAKSFSEQLPQYRENPTLFRSRLLTETWNRILTNSHDKIYVPERADGKARELRLELNREPPKARSAETNAPAP